MLNNTSRLIELERLLQIDSSSLLALERYDEFASLVYRLRSDNSDPELLKRLELSLTLIGGKLLAHRIAQRGPGIYRRWRQRYTNIWRRERMLLFFVTALFAASCLSGWGLGLGAPDLAAVIVPQAMFEEVFEHHSWFKELEKAPLLGSLTIAWNNIMVCVRCFCAGALLGLGGLVVLIFNGLSFGAIVGLCAAHDFHEPLVRFVLSHGPLELSVIVSSAVASMIYGRVFFMRPWSKFPQRFSAGARDAGVLALGVTPWLLLAGFFEGFISPSELLSNPLRILLGSSAALLFWWWNFGGPVGLTPSGVGATRQAALNDLVGKAKRSEQP